MAHWVGRTIGKFGFRHARVWLDPLTCLESGPVISDSELNPCHPVYMNNQNPSRHSIRIYSNCRASQHPTSTRPTRPAEFRRNARVQSPGGV
jgi:hypothetical protein